MTVGIFWTRRFEEVMGEIAAVKAAFEDETALFGEVIDVWLQYVQDRMVAYRHGRKDGSGGNVFAEPNRKQ